MVQHKTCKKMTFNTKEVHDTHPSIRPLINSKPSYIRLKDGYCKIQRYGGKIFQNLFFLNDNASCSALQILSSPTLMHKLDLYYTSAIALKRQNSSPLILQLVLG